jgi:hypothetical protein
MGFGLSAVYFLMAGGILWRVIEVPLIPEVEDDLRFAVSIPTNDETQPGRDLRRAIATYIKQAEPHQRTAAERPFGSVFSRESFARRGFYAKQTIKDQIAEIPQFGYPENRPDIDAYLDAVAGGAEWLDHLDKIRGREPGVVVDPNLLTFMSNVPELDDIGKLIPTTLARGLQEQARGRPDLFLVRLEASLAATRSVKKHSVYNSIRVGRALEKMATSSVGPWLSQLDNDPKLLRRCLAILKEQEKYCVSPQTDMILAEQVLVRNMFRDPHQWYSSEQVWGRSGAAKDDSSREADLLQFAWNVPWEKERLRRAIGLGNVEVPPAGLWERLWSIRGKPDRAAMLQVALRLFVAERGKPPESLDELVPDYLPAVPVDPYDPAKKPFQYRVSPGEWIYIDERPSSTDPPGWDEGTKIPSLAFAAVAAAGGGATNWPRVVAFDYPPGFSPEFTIDDTDDLAMIAGLGGFVLWPQGLFELGAGGPGDIPGGVPLGFSAPDADPIIVAATGGALAFELWGILDIESAPYEERDPIETQKERFIPRWLKPGEMIVWSVGRDGLDDRGTMQLLNNGSFNRGDLLSIVPPPKPQSPPVSGGTK